MLLLQLTDVYIYIYMYKYAICTHEIFAQINSTARSRPALRGVAGGCDLSPPADPPDGGAPPARRWPLNCRAVCSGRRPSACLRRYAAARRATRHHAARREEDDGGTRDCEEGEGEDEGWGLGLWRGGRRRMMEGLGTARRERRGKMRARD